MEKSSTSSVGSPNDPKGSFKNHSDRFQKRRQEQRDLERAMIDKKKIFLEDHKKDAPQSSGYFASLLPSTKCCRACGNTPGLLSFDGFKTCLKCHALFCEKCVKDIDPTDLCIDEFLGVNLRTIDMLEWYLCELCGIYFHEVQVLRWKSIVEEARETSPLLAAYNELKALRGEIERVYPHYEYLSQSILEVAPEKYDKAYAAIYADVKQRQNQLWSLLRQYQLGLKKIMSLEGSCDTEQAVLRNLRSDLSNYAQLRLPTLKRYQARIAQLEVEGLSDVFVLLVQLENDMRALPSVWETFGKAFDLCAHRVRSEVQTATTQANLSFDDWMKQLESKIHEKSRVNDLKGLSVGTVIRKVAERIRAIEKVIHRRGIEAPITLDVLAYLAKTLEETYDKSVSYSNWKSAK